MSYWNGTVHWRAVTGVIFNQYPPPPLPQPADTPGPEQPALLRHRYRHPACIVKSVPLIGVEPEGEEVRGAGDMAWGEHSWQEAGQLAPSLPHGRRFAETPGDAFRMVTVQLTRAPLGYFYNAPHWGGGGLFRAPPSDLRNYLTDSKNSSGIWKPWKKLSRENKFYWPQGHEWRHRSGKSQNVRTFRAWWHWRAKLRC